MTKAKAKKAAYVCVKCGAQVYEGEYTPELKKTGVCSVLCKGKKSEPAPKPEIKDAKPGEIKAGDKVEVLDGKDKGLKGTVAKVEPEKKEPEKVYIKEFVRHDFTSPEFNAMQKDLALKISAQRMKENEKSAITKQLTADVEALRATVDSLADKINTGYETRYLECEVVYDWKAKMKSIVNPETGEIVRTVPVNEDDLQTKLKFDEGQAEKK